MTGYVSAFDLYHRLGWSVLPLPKGKKKHPPKGYTGHNGIMPSYADMQAWSEDKPDGNLAIRLPRNIIGIDVDHYEDKRGGDTLAEAENRWGRLPPSNRSTSRDDGVSGIRLCRIPEGVELRECIEFPDKDLGGVEICQFHHRYVMCWPSIHPEGNPYRWYAEIDGSVMDDPPALDDIPELPARWAAELTETPQNDAELPPDGHVDVCECLTDGEPSQRVAFKLGVALGDLFSGKCRHDAILEYVLGLLRCGKNGEPGVKQALNALCEAFVNRVAKDRPGGRDEALREFKSLVYGDNVPALLANTDYDNEPEAGSGDADARSGATEFDESAYVVSLVSASEIVSDIPDWSWEYEDLGRIQLGVLTLFAGRPGAGKSTAARWFAAQFSNGALAGCWKNKPQKVAYIACEESLEQVVKPGLQLAGADMSNIVFPRVTFSGETVALMSDRDEAGLTKQLKAQGVTAIFVDPIMATIRSKVDIYRNNDLRQALAPWVRIAQRIGGIVIGVVHLVKGNSGDVVASVNGSSAFGEVARCVFGFVKDPHNDGERVMSQVRTRAVSRTCPWNTGSTWSCSLPTADARD